MGQNWPALLGPNSIGELPASVAAPVQYGPRIGSFVVYLQNHQLLPEKRLAMLMADLHGVRLTTATLPGSTRTMAHGVSPWSTVCASRWPRPR